MSERKFTLSPASRHLAVVTLKQTKEMLPLYDAKSAIILEETEQYLVECLKPQLAKLQVIRARIRALRRTKK